MNKLEKLHYSPSLVLTLTAMLAVSVVSGCGSDANARDATITYVCTETNEVVVGPPQSVPALNPSTGRHTLLRGVYCAECKQWYASPPPDSAPGNPTSLQCKIHNIPMSYTGPDDADNTAWSTAGTNDE